MSTKVGHLLSCASAVLAAFARGGVVASILLLGLSGCDLIGFKRWEWHQRLVLEVETPGGIVSGGSVVAVEAEKAPKWLPGEGAGGLGTKVVGEASFVEIAPGKYLFALLGSEADLALTLFFPEQAQDTFERAERLQVLRETRVVPKGRYPVLVTFVDIRDPETITKVDPDNLAAAFGRGVSLKRLAIEITDAAPTNDRIEKIIPWWLLYKNRQLDGDRYINARSNYPLANSINLLFFKKD